MADAPNTIFEGFSVLEPTQNRLKIRTKTLLQVLAECICTFVRATYWEGCGAIFACVDRILTRSSEWPMRTLGTGH
jgi:hypothetical protein